MSTFSLRLAKNIWQKYAVVILLLCWSVGFFGGLICIDSAYERYAGIMCNVAATDASIIGLFLTGAIPLFLSYLVIRLSAAPLILPITFAKAFGFAFCSFGVLWSCGSAGWLIRILLLFTDSLWVLILLYFWVRFVKGEDKSMPQALLWSMAAAAFGILIDYLYIVPLLQSLTL